jgi:hypothetical protein
MFNLKPKTMSTHTRTINFKGIDFEVEYDYQPYEPAERGPEAQYPGCSESIEQVTSMTHKGTDFIDLIYNESEDEIKTIILESIRN